MGFCFELNRASLDADGSVQCKRKPDGTPCTRSFGKGKFRKGKCCDGKCRVRRHAVVREVLCPSEEVKYDQIMHCLGKPNGTPCALLCKDRKCRPPFTRCCHGQCFRGRCPSRRGWFAKRCKGMPDGSSCATICRLVNCAPPFSRCCSGHCRRGREPLYEITKKTEFCPR